MACQRRRAPRSGATEPRLHGALVSGGGEAVAVVSGLASLTERVHQRTDPSSDHCIVERLRSPRFPHETPLKPKTQMASCPGGLASWSTVTWRALITGSLPSRSIISAPPRHVRLSSHPFDRHQLWSTWNMRFGRNTRQLKDCSSAGTHPLRVLSSCSPRSRGKAPCVSGVSSRSDKLSERHRMLTRTPRRHSTNATTRQVRRSGRSGVQGRVHACGHASSARSHSNRRARK